MPAFDLVIIGAGPGGYATALRAAELGMSVALVERDEALGGTCLNRGCIPSKALIGAAHTMDEARRAVDMGVLARLEGLDYGKLRDYRRSVVSSMTSGLASLLAARKVAIFQAEARFDAAETSADGNRVVHLTPSNGLPEVLRVTTPGSGEGQGVALDLTAPHVVLSPGARPRPLPGVPFGAAVIDSTQALELDTFPASAVVIGAGAVAVEFASLWNAAGVKVTLVIRKDRVLSSWDRRAGVTLTRELERRGIEVVRGTAVQGIDTGVNMGARVHLSQAGADGTETERIIEAELALAAIGRDPATDGGWLANAPLTDSGHIRVDELGRVEGADGVWAVGDAVAGPALAHRAFQQGIAVAEAIAGLDPTPVDDMTIPQVVFGMPEAACVGLTGPNAKADPRWRDVKETAYPMMGNARMLMSGSAGSLTVVTGRPAGGGSDDTPELVLGVHIVAPVASDLIAEAEQLVGNHVPLHDAARLIHPHPTFSESLGEALLKADGRPLHTR